MRYLNKVIFLNSAHIPYAEVKIDGNVHFIGTQGVGKSTLLRAILFFYNADKLRLGIPKEKKGFDAFYLPFANSYIVYEVMRENGAYSVIVAKQTGRAAFRFVDAPYSRQWFVDQRREVSADWSEIRSRIAASEHCHISPVVNYETYRDIIFGNNRNPDMAIYRKYAIVESPKYQNIPRTIQNVFLNSKLDADFIKDTIIRSMSDEDLFIDLTYYRSQIETFEHEYNDVMLWLKPDKRGEIVVRRQAGRAIDRYRSLLVLKSDIRELRECLNYAEEVAQQRLPALAEEITKASEALSRITRLMGEETAKYNAERDKLNAERGRIDADLKRVRDKQKFYAEHDIGQVTKRVAAEAALRNKLEGLKKTLAALTAAYSDITAKYERMAGQIDLEHSQFENGKKAEIVALEAKANSMKGEMREQCDAQKEQIRAAHDEQLRAINNRLTEAIEHINSLKIKRKDIQHTTYFDKEISEYSREIELLRQQSQQAAVEIERLKVEAEKLRQKCRDEVAEAEKPFNEKIDRLASQRENARQEAEQLKRRVERYQNSLLQWLDANVPGWQGNIGRVADLELILLNNELHPRLLQQGGNGSLYGVELDLTAIERDVPSLAQMQQQLAHKLELCNSLSAQLQKAIEEKTASTDRINERCNKAVRTITEQQKLLEIKAAQIPAKEKNAQAQLAAWQKKADEKKQAELELIDKEINVASLEKLKIEAQRDRIDEEKEKQLKLRDNECRKSQKAVDAQLQQQKQAIAEAIAAHMAEADKRKAELMRSQEQELSGRGADTAVIGSYQAQITAIDKELRYIEEHRRLVSDYEKDCREYFDNEQLWRSQRAENASRMTDLESKYQERHKRLSQQLTDARNKLDALTREQDELNDDLKKLGNFCSDEILSPIEEMTRDKRATLKSCSAIIEELRSLIVSLGSETNEFKKAINTFKSNFSPQNIFKFRTELQADDDYFQFAANLSEFVDNDKIMEYKSRISERYTDIIKRVAKEVGDLTQNESEIVKTIRDINNDFISRNFAGVIKRIELRSLGSDNKLMQLLEEIQRFNEENQFNMGPLDLFSQDNRAEVNERAVGYLHSFSRLLRDELARTRLVIADTFKLEFRIMENDNDTGWVEKIGNVGSDGTDILVKAMVNIMLINVFKERASRKFGDFKIHCMMDEIGKLHPNNVKGIIAFANSRNILLINSSPTTYNVEDYRYTYLLSKDTHSNTRIVLLMNNKQLSRIDGQQ